MSSGRKMGAKGAAFLAAGWWALWLGGTVAGGYGVAPYRGMDIRQSYESQADEYLAISGGVGECSNAAFATVSLLTCAYQKTVGVGELEIRGHFAVTVPPDEFCKAPEGLVVRMPSMRRLDSILSPSGYVGITFRTTAPGGGWPYKLAPANEGTAVSLAFVDQPLDHFFDAQNCTWFDAANPPALLPPGMTTSEMRPLAPDFRDIGTSRAAKASRGAGMVAVSALSTFLDQLKAFDRPLLYVSPAADTIDPAWWARMRLEGPLTVDFHQCARRVPGIKGDWVHDPAMLWAVHPPVNLGF